MDSSGRAACCKQMSMTTSRASSVFLEDSHIDCPLLARRGLAVTLLITTAMCLELTGERIGEIDPSLLRLIEEADDPAEKLLCQQQKQRGCRYFSTPSASMTAHDFPLVMNGLRSTFKVEHPEWAIGAGTSGGAILLSHRNLNFCGARSARSEVCRH